MTIKEAALQAQRQGQGMYRESETLRVVIIPTDTAAGCICTGPGKKAGPGWQPRLSDLIADDWRITS